MPRSRAGCPPIGLGRAISLWAAIGASRRHGVEIALQRLPPSQAHDPLARRKA